MKSEAITCLSRDSTRDRKPRICNSNQPAVPSKNGTLYYSIHDVTINIVPNPLKVRLSQNFQLPSTTKATLKTCKLTSLQFLYQLPCDYRSLFHVVMKDGETRNSDLRQGKADETERGNELRL